MKNKKSFKPDIKDYNIISDEKADFIYKHSRDYLLETIKTYELLQNKITVLLGFILFLNSVLFISKTSLYIKNNSIIPVIILSYSFIAIYLLIAGFSPKKHGFIGNEPRSLLKQEFIEQELRFIKISETINYQSVIDNNIEKNKKLSDCLMVSTYLVVTPIVCTIIYFLL